MRKRNLLRKLLVMATVLVMIIALATGCKSEEKKKVDISDMEGTAAPDTPTPTQAVTATPAEDTPIPTETTPSPELSPVEETPTPTEAVPEPTEEPVVTEAPEKEGLPEGWTTEKEDFQHDDVIGFEEKTRDEKGRLRILVERKRSEEYSFALEFRLNYTYTDGSNEVLYSEEFIEYDLDWDKVLSYGSGKGVHVMESPDNMIEVFCGWVDPDQYDANGVKIKKPEGCNGDEFTATGEKVKSIEIMVESDYTGSETQPSTIPEGVAGKWVGKGVPANGGSPIDLTVTIKEDGSGEYQFEQAGYKESYPFTVDWNGNTFCVSIPENNLLGITDCGGYWSIEDGKLKLEIHTGFKNGGSYSYNAECSKER